MVIKRSQTTEIKANAESTIWDYPMPTEETGITFQTLTGRLPEKGWYINKVCHEIIFITDGKAEINIDGESHQLEKGDVVILKPGQKHFGKYLKTSLITITSPNWYEEQCDILDEK